MMRIAASLYSNRSCPDLNLNWNHKTTASNFSSTSNYISFPLRGICLYILDWRLIVRHPPSTSYRTPATRTITIYISLAWLHRAGDRLWTVSACILCVYNHLTCIYTFKHIQVCIHIAKPLWYLFSFILRSFYFATRYTPPTKRLTACLLAALLFDG